MSSQPAVVVVPGSFSTTEFYDGFVSALRSAGFDTVEVIKLRSVWDPKEQKDRPQAATMADDAAYIASIVEKHADAGRDVLLVPHSYSGIPATESVNGLSKKARLAAGKKGGIVRLLYTTAIVPGPGQSSTDVMGSGIEALVNIDGDYMWLDPTVHAAATFSDLPEDEALAWAKKFLYHSTVTFSGPLTYPGYKDVPVSYLFCETDKVVPPELQKSIIATIEKESGQKVDVYSIPSGHVPHISRTEDVVDAVKRAAAAQN